MTHRLTRCDTSTDAFDLCGHVGYDALLSPPGKKTQLPPLGRQRKQVMAHDAFALAPPPRLWMAAPWDQLRPSASERESEETRGRDA